MALFLHKNIDKDTDLGCWKIEESSEYLTSRLQLNADEERLIASFKSRKRLLHWLATRVLLRTMLHTNDYITCEVDADGKPFLPHQNCHISFSHSGDYVAVIISKSRAVGVDIEGINPRIRAIKHKFLSDVELAQPQIGDHLFALSICWCAKEAIYKWYGKKGLEFKKHIHIQPFVLKEQGMLSVVVHLPHQDKEVVVHYFKITAEDVLAYIIA